MAAEQSVESVSVRWKRHLVQSDTSDTAIDSASERVWASVESTDIVPSETAIDSDSGTTLFSGLLTNTAEIVPSETAIDSVSGRVWASAGSTDIVPSETAIDSVSE